MDNFLALLHQARFPIHLVLHFLIPFIVSRFSNQSKKVFWIMVLTMLVDIDHLLATPITDPNRCSIGFHPLHSYWIQPVYVGLLFYPKTKWIGAGLVIHMVLDALDCVWMKLT